jgi:hypothetical protein
MSLPENPVTASLKTAVNSIVGDEVVLAWMLAWFMVTVTAGVATRISSIDQKPDPPTEVSVASLQRSWTLCPAAEAGNLPTVVN